MSRLPQPNSTIDAELADVYRDMCEVMQLPSPTNFFTSMALRPDLAAATWGLVKLMFSDGQLPPFVTQLMAAAISKRADCVYCADAHGRALESFGFDQAMLERFLEDSDDPSIPEVQRGIVSFAIRAADDPNSITDADVERLREIGVTDEEFVEIGIVIALTKFSNTWADATGLSLDAVN